MRERDLFGRWAKNTQALDERITRQRLSAIRSALEGEPASQVGKSGGNTAPNQFNHLPQHQLTRTAHWSARWLGSELPSQEDCY